MSAAEVTTRADRDQRPAGVDAAEGRAGEAGAVFGDDALGHDERAERELGRERAARAGGDDERGAREARRALGEGGGAEPDTGELDAAGAEVGKGRAGDGGEAEMAREPARLELDGGEDQQRPHRWGVGLPWAFAAALRSSQAA